MRHRKANPKLGKPTDQRLALLRGLAAGMVLDSHVETTLARAKVARPFVEKLVTKAVRGRRLDQAADASTDQVQRQELRAQAIHLRRLVRRDLHNPNLVKHLFDQVAPHFVSRAGGYTRIMRTGRRRGDGAEMAILSFVE
ncbi:MAG: 50S ribosomal protein L17 [Armatimonadetes bacterium]|nr:50S ribosomal protein L17 [Armatimonadota bacterium]